jgi:hypothetical protein
VSEQARATLLSDGFAEGWAHYGEELALEQASATATRSCRRASPIEALVRVTRLRVAIGVHTGALTVARAPRPSPRTPACRAGGAVGGRGATYDPTYGRYTWGKLGLLAPARARTAAAGLRPAPVPHRPAGARITAARADGAALAG